MTKNGTRAAALLLPAALAIFPRPALADSACIAAYEQAQTLRKDGKPVAARVQAALCAKEGCPALLTKDCTRWVNELEALTPSVVLEPRAPNGRLRADVRVKLDGTRVAEKMDGRALPVEPGSHTLVFEADGLPAVVRIVQLREGEKNKKVTVTMAAAAEPTVLVRPIPAGVWLFGGASVFAFATSAAFAMDGLLKKNDLDQCRPRCGGDAVDAMSARFTYADVALGAGVMAGAAAVYFLLTRPEVEAPQPSSAAFNAVPFAAPLPGGGALGLGATF